MLKSLFKAGSTATLIKALPLIAIAVTVATARSGTINIVVGQPVAAGEAPLEADFIWTGEDSTDGTTLTTTILDNATDVESGAPAGSWSLTGSGSNMQVDAFDQQTLSSFLVDGVTYDDDPQGSRGVEIAMVAAETYFAWTWTTAPSTVTLGCWFKTPATATGDWNQQDFLVLGKDGGSWLGLYLVSESADTWKLNMHQDEGDDFVADLDEDTVYWLTMLYDVNSTCKAQVFNTSGVSQGSNSRADADSETIEVLTVGPQSSHAALAGQFVRFDDIVMELSDVFPLGP